MNIPALFAAASLNPIVIVSLVLAGIMYARGLSYSTKHGLARQLRWWHAAAFFVGLYVVLVALGGPFDYWADRLFWVHMLQHELLTIVAAPLLLFGAPLMLLWRAVPLGARRTSLGWVLQRGWPLQVWHGIARVLGAPRVAWALFAGVFVLWHLPPLYDLALERTPIHILEHAMFLGTALLFWAQVIPSRPLHRRMSYLFQALYVGTSAVVMNGLAAMYMFSVSPIYPYYAALPRPVGTVSVLVDQHLAGAVMDVPGTMLFFTAIVALLALWLRDDERTSTQTGPTLAGGRWSAGFEPTAPDAQPSGQR